jgi:hypothetical protein
VTPLPPEAFSDVVGRSGSHAPLFEYEIQGEGAAVR